MRCSRSLAKTMWIIKSLLSQTRSVNILLSTTARARAHTYSQRAGALTTMTTRAWSARRRERLFWDIRLLAQSTRTFRANSRGEIPSDLKWKSYPSSAAVSAYLPRPCLPLRKLGQITFLRHIDAYIIQYSANQMINIKWLPNWKSEDRRRGGREGRKAFKSANAHDKTHGAKCVRVHSACTRAGAPKIDANLALFRIS